MEVTDNHKLLFKFIHSLFLCCNNFFPNQNGLRVCFFFACALVCVYCFVDLLSVVLSCINCIPLNIPLAKVVQVCVFLAINSFSIPLW